MRFNQLKVGHEFIIDGDTDVRFKKINDLNALVIRDYVDVNKEKSNLRPIDPNANVTILHD